MPDDARAGETWRALVERARLPAGVRLRRPASGQPPRYRPPRPNPLSCQIDGQPISGHRRCRACTILVGPGHYVPGLDTAPLCPGCQRRACGLCPTCRRRARCRPKELRQ